MFETEIYGSRVLHKNATVGTRFLGVALRLLKSVDERKLGLGSARLQALGQGYHFRIKG